MGEFLTISRFLSYMILNLERLCLGDVGADLANRIHLQQLPAQIYTSKATYNSAIAILLEKHSVLCSRKQRRKDGPPGRKATW